VELVKTSINLDFPERMIEEKKAFGGRQNLSEPSWKVHQTSEWSLFHWTSF
jgi:hypothetical protein